MREQERQAQLSMSFYSYFVTCFYCFDYTLQRYTFFPIQQLFFSPDRCSNGLINTKQSISVPSFFTFFVNIDLKYNISKKVRIFAFRLKTTIHQYINKLDKNNEYHQRKLRGIGPQYQG